MFSNLYKVIRKTVDVTKEFSKNATAVYHEQAYHDALHINHGPQLSIMNYLTGVFTEAERANGVPYEDYEDPFEPARGSLPCSPYERIYSESDILARLRPPAWHQFSITEAERSAVVVEDPTMSFCEARRSCQLEVVFQPLASVGKALEEELTHRVFAPLLATIVHKIVLLACGKSDVLPP